jgi:putative endonuclease
MGMFCVYILASRSRRLYTGVTNNLPVRLAQHRQKVIRGFTRKYDLTRLVYYECTCNVRSAIAREKQIKGRSRNKKLALISGTNPDFRDLSEDWAGTSRDSSPLRGSE